MNTRDYLDVKNWDETDDAPAFLAKKIIEKMTEKDAVVLIHKLLYAQIDIENWSYNDYRENAEILLQEVIDKYK